MYKKFTAFALVAIFSVSSVAFAAVQDLGKFSIDVPSDWSIARDGNTVSITADDNSAALTVTVEENDGTDLKLIAKEYAKQFKGTAPVFEDDVYVLSFVNENEVECNVVISGDKDMYVMLMIAGENDKMEDIVDSIEFK